MPNSSRFSAILWCRLLAPDRAAFVLRVCGAVSAGTGRRGAFVGPRDASPGSSGFSVTSGGVVFSYSASAPPPPAACASLSGVSLERGSHARRDVPSFARLSFSRLVVDVRVTCRTHALFARSQHPVILFSSRWPFDISSGRNNVAYEWLIPPLGKLLFSACSLVLLLLFFFLAVLQVTRLPRCSTRSHVEHL